MGRMNRLVAGLLVLSASLVASGCATALGSAVEQGDVEGVKALLNQGADINEYGACNPNTGRGPAIHCAANAGNVEVAKLLIERGANVNAELRGKTALDFAVFQEDVEMVQLLLEHGAQVPGGPNIQCYPRGIIDTCTAMEYAKLKGNTKIVRLLEQAEGKESAKLEESSSPPPSVKADTSVAPVSDVDTLPAVRAQARSNAYAIVVGIERYQQKLPQADFAAHDAEIMGQYLTKTLGYAEENVALLLNDRAAKADIEKYFEKWLPNRVEKDASVFVYFSGHGAPNPKTGNAYLVPYDGDPAFVDETGYALKRLYQQMDKLPARDVVVMLDSCFSGAGGRSVIGKGMRPMVLSGENPVLASGKTVVLAASAGDQVSSTHDKKSHGLLTYFFLKGLQGEADSNKDGTVELKELFAYLKPQVERTARREYNNEQQPQLLGSPDLLTKGIRLVESVGPSKP